MDNLYEKLEQYSQSDYVPLHMPGHKRQSDKVNLETAYIDITEIDGFDDYHYPEGIIDKIQKQAAKVYGTKETFYLVNGSSCGLLAAISAVTRHKDGIIVARNSHKAVYNAVFVNELKPYYIYPDVDKNTGIFVGMSPKEVRTALDMTDYKVVVITSPTYEGVVSDVASIAEICHEKGAILIVDEAHGAHFNYSNEFPQTAMKNGADIVIESVHKTLPSYTQTALIHVNSDRVDMARLRKYLSVYQTSSPSYVFMAGINKCINYMTSENGRADNKLYISKLKELRNEAGNLKNIKLFVPEGYESDISKIVLYARNKGAFLYEQLLLKYHIQLEMAAKDYVIAMTSVCDKEIWYERFVQALKELDKEIIPAEGYNSIYNLSACVEVSPIDADGMDSENVEFEKSENRICLECIYAYPPGIPILYPGEKITGKIIDEIKDMRKNGIIIKGFSDQRGEYIKCAK